MEVSNPTASAVSALANNQQPQPRQPKNEAPQQEQQSSTVVKLSAQAQQLNRSESQSSSTERSESRPKETAEPAGIKFMEGESKGGRVNTFA